MATAKSRILHLCSVVFTLKEDSLDKHNVFGFSIILVARCILFLPISYEAPP